jgi:4-amino-4-deoxy-L-arabinose transferase-like glycosyltransferase
MTSRLIRPLLLLLLLLAFSRLVFELGGKNFWWDESLSLQRSESTLFRLLRGQITITDGTTSLETIDQHPFFSFLVQGLAIRLAGNSEFALRFPSAASATLLVALVWAMGALLEKKQVFPKSAALWSTLLAAINPFFLWYGQEARPYALWAALTLLSTYLLLRISFVHKSSRKLILAYIVSLLCLLSTHYLALYVIPVHALLIFSWLLRKNLRSALLNASGMIAVGVLGSLYAVAMIIGPTGIGDSGPGFNFPESVGLDVMIPDLLNAFSMGLSVNINDVWWLDLICGLLITLGIFWGFRSKVSIGNGGWLLVLILITPVAALQVMLHLLPIRAPYMNARHMSLIGGPFILLLGSGIGVVWLRQKLVALALVALIVGGSGYSTYNYFTDPYYDKEEYAELGNYLHDHLLPGDILLLNPSHAKRVYEYYLPLKVLDEAKAAGAQVEYISTPRIGNAVESTEEVMNRAQTEHKRIWLATSGTPSEVDPLSLAQKWLDDNNFRLQFVRFHAYQSILDLYLFLPYPPVMGDPRIDEKIQFPADVTFDNQIRLVGYSTAPALRDDMALPVTLFWQTKSLGAENYKYILQLVETNPSGESNVLTFSEEEPYETVVPTSIWRPEQTLIEYTELPPPPHPLLADAHYELRLQLYRVSTLEKVPVTAHDEQKFADQTMVDEVTIRLPYTRLPSYVATDDQK